MDACAIYKSYKTHNTYAHEVLSKVWHSLEHALLRHEISRWLAQVYRYLLFSSRLGLDKRIYLVMYYMTKEGKIVDHTTFHKRRQLYNSFLPQI